MRRLPTSTIRQRSKKIRAAGVALSVAEDDAPYAQLRLWNPE
jgi:hypothetical protein